MAFASSNGETVIIRTPPRRDNYGDVIAGSATDTAVQDCLVAPGASSEAEDHSRQVLASADVYVPEGYTITAHDQLVVRGEVYEVIEKPRVWINEAVEIPVRRVTG